MKNKFSVQLMSALIVCSLSGCKKDKDFEEGQRKEEDLVRNLPYKNAYSKEQFLNRATNDFDPMLKEFWDAFNLDPNPPETSESFVNSKNQFQSSLSSLSALSVIRSFANKTLTSQKKTSSLSLASLDDDIVDLAFNIPSPFLPGPYRNIKKGNSCQVASYAIETGYSHGIDYAKKIISVVSNTDNQQLPEDVNIINNPDYAQAYVLRFKGNDFNDEPKGSISYAVGGDSDYINIVADGDLSAKFIEEGITYIFDKSLKGFSILANTTKKNIDLQAYVSDSVNIECSPETIFSKSFVSYYYSSISLGKNPSITDGLINANNPRKAGYNFIVNNANCIDETSSYSNIELAGKFLVTATAKNKNELAIKIVDVSMGAIDNQETEQNFTTEWTFLKDADECTVSRVVQDGKEIP